MTDLLIRFKMPILSEEELYSQKLSFMAWFPVGHENAITINEDDMELKLWFSIQSYWKEIEPQGNEPFKPDMNINHSLDAYWIYADIVIKSVPETLTNFIFLEKIFLEDTQVNGIQNQYDPSFQERHLYLLKLKENISSHNQIIEEDLRTQLQSQCEDLAWRALSFSLKKLNRFIDYVRTRHHHWWLKPYVIDEGDVRKRYRDFGAKASLDGTYWFWFSPKRGASAVSKVIVPAAFIKKEEWDDIQQFVTSKRRTLLHEFLLANAMILASKRYNRSAVVEACTALEVALNRFVQTPITDKLSLPFSSTRKRDEKLDKLVEKFGFSRSINVLLPLIIPESLADSSTFDELEKVITLRGSIVHNGTREVKHSEVYSSLNVISKMCHILQSLTKQSA